MWKTRFVHCGSVPEEEVLPMSGAEVNSPNSVESSSYQRDCH
jgi:hypothetical protein